MIRGEGDRQRLSCGDRALPGDYIIVDRGPARLNEPAPEIYLGGQGIGEQRVGFAYRCGVVDRDGVSHRAVVSHRLRDDVFHHHHLLRGVNHMPPQVRECVLGIARPLSRWIEGVVAVGVTLHDLRLADEGVIFGGGITAAPGRTWVDADLADHVNDLPVVEECHGIIAVEVHGGRVFKQHIGLVKDSVICLIRGQHKHISVSHRAGDRVDLGGRRRAVGIQRDRVVAGESDCAAGAVVDLQGLVVAAPFDVFGEEKLCRPGGFGGYLLRCRQPYPGECHHQCQGQKCPGLSLLSIHL